MAVMITDSACGTLSSVHLYGEPSRDLYDFVEQQYHSASSALMESARTWAASATGIFQKVSYDDAVRVARGAVRNLSALGQYDGVTVLSSIGRIQTASETMRRWIMADPVTRGMWIAGDCEGYADHYHNHSQLNGEAFYDYRRVMDGVVVDSEDGTWHATTFMEELVHESDELTIEQQSDILATWKHVRRHLEAKQEDPTSRWNSTL